MHTLPLLHTVRLGDGRTLRATGSAGSFVTAWLLEPTVNSTCVLAVTAPWSVRVYVAARETHGRVCPLCYLLPVTLDHTDRPSAKKSSLRRAIKSAEARVGLGSKLLLESGVGRAVCAERSSAKRLCAYVSAGRPNVLKLPPTKAPFCCCVMLSVLFYMRLLGV